VECGADTDLANDHGNTALHYTAFWGFEDCAIYLLEAGASKVPINRYGRTALSRASTELMAKIDEAGLAESPKSTRQIARGRTGKSTRKGRTLIEAQIENKLRFLSKGISR
jgi:hypothetical protein